MKYQMISMSFLTDCKTGINNCDWLKKQLSQNILMCQRGQVFILNLSMHVESIYTEEMSQSFDILQSFEECKNLQT